MSLLGALQGYRALGPATGAMIDVSFELTGRVLPADYSSALAEGVFACLPWAREDTLFGIHPLRAPLTDAGIVLSRRSRLQLRVPASRADEALRLSGAEIVFDTERLAIGRATARPVTAFSTLGAHLVVGDGGDEQAFVDQIGMQLEVLEVGAEIICGKPSTVSFGGRPQAGFAVVLHGLSDSHALRLQAIGLGPGRAYGCGVFVHHKIIDLPDVSPE